MKGIIPSGGRGTRMQPLTFSVNKHFIPVANKPLIFYPIEAVAQAGIKDIAITYNPGYLDAVRGLLGDGGQWGLEFTYVLQEKPIGLANIVEVCEEFIAGDKFVFHLGDNIFASGIKKAVDYFLKEKPHGLVTMIHHPENRRMGVPYFDKQMRLVKYVEKPTNPPHDYAVPGVYFGDSSFFEAFHGKDRIKPSTRGEYEITAPFQWLIEHGYRVDVIEYEGKWLDPGKFNDWIEANQYLLDTRLNTCIESEISDDSLVENRVCIGQNCQIIKSKIRGPAIIGKNVTIRNSFIGPFTSISDNVEIINSHVENSVVMEGVKIANVESPIDASLIGAHSEVVRSVGPTRTHRFFVGNKCQIQL